MSRHANRSLPWFLAVLLCCAPPLLADGPQTGTIDGVDTSNTRRGGEALLIGSAR